MIKHFLLPLTLALSAQAMPDYKEVKPLIDKYCVSCHGPDKQKSKLRLDSPEGILLGGDSGEPVFVAGDSANSHLIKLVTGAAPDEVMPPKGDRLSNEDVLKLQLWIDEGAPLKRRPQHHAPHDGL